MDSFCPSGVLPCEFYLSLEKGKAKSSALLDRYISLARLDSFSTLQERKEGDFKGRSMGQSLVE